MASAFSYYATCFHYSSDRNNQLTQSPRASHCFRSSHLISNSGLTVELIRLLIGTVVPSRIRNPSHSFMEPQRMTLTGPRGNQGGFYDILQQFATGSSHADVRAGHYRLRLAE